MINVSGLFLLENMYNFRHNRSKEEENRGHIFSMEKVTTFFRKIKRGGTKRFFTASKS